MEKEFKICLNCNKKFFFWEMKNIYGGMTSQSWKVKKYCCKKCANDFYFKNNPDRNTRVPFYKVRFNIFKRDSFRCIYCSRSSIEDGVYLEVEHLNPRVGKKESWEEVKEEDLATACRDCNVGKGKNKLDLPILTRIKNKITKK